MVAAIRNTWRVPGKKPLGYEAELGRVLKVPLVQGRAVEAGVWPHVIESTVLGSLFGISGY